MAVAAGRLEEVLEFVAAAVVVAGGGLRSMTIDSVAPTQTLHCWSVWSP